MRLLALSDIHSNYKDLPILKAADAVLCAGDMTNFGTLPEIAIFLEWFSNLPYKTKIATPGNHDLNIQNNPTFYKYLFKAHGIHLLIDEEIILGSLKIFGYPWTPLFGNWEFMLPRDGEELRDTVSKIPVDTDILLSHGPMFGYLDKAYNESLGCALLTEHVKKLTQLQYFICGHIHENPGITRINNTTVLNVSSNQVQYIEL